MAYFVGPAKVFAQKSTTDPIQISILYTGNLLGKTEVSDIANAHTNTIERIMGCAQRIEQIKKETKHCILVDTGNLWQSEGAALNYTRYSIIQAMNIMGYHACGLGRQEIETNPNELSILTHQAKFDFLSCNIPAAMQNHSLKISAYTILQCDSVKIGILGVNAPEKTAQNEANKSATAFIKKIDQIAAQLKKKEHCHLVVCISQLAQDEKEHAQENNFELAKSSEYIDLIIGGKKSIKATKPLKVTNKKKNVVWLTQLGTENVYLGRIDYTFFSKKTFFTTNAQTVELLK